MSILVAANRIQILIDGTWLTQSVLIFQKIFLFDKEIGSEFRPIKPLKADFIDTCRLSLHTNLNVYHPKSYKLSLVVS